MRSIYKRVRAKAYFLSPEEGGRNDPVEDLRDTRYPYELLADVGLGYTEDDFPIRCMARVHLEGGPGHIELGVEQTVQVELQGVEHAVIEPGSAFELCEGAKVVARVKVISVLESVLG